MNDYKVVTVRMSGNNTYPRFCIRRPGQYEYELRNYSEASLDRLTRLLQSAESLTHAELDIVNSKIEYWLPIKEATDETIKKDD